MMPKVRDADCVALARDALFPLKISRDGSHPTQFPASEALSKIRDSLMANSPDQAASSFFPRRVVVVRDVNSTSELKWNGQPDVSLEDASVEVIPNLLSVRSMNCADGRDAFVEKNPDKVRRALVLCSDRLLKSDYSHSNMPRAPKSLNAIEETLAHHLTKIGDQLESERTTNAPDPASTCQGLAAMEIRAARAAECYYSKAGKEVTRGSSLGPYGYSTFPKFLQEMLRSRCIRSVASKAMDKSEFGSEGRKCVSEVFDEANRD